MKRCNVVLVVGLFVIFLLAAPKLRADGTDIFNYVEHNNTAFADKDNDDHSHAWWADKDADKDNDHQWHVWHHDSGGWSFGGGTGDSDDGKTGADAGSGSTTFSITEPSTLVLLISSFLAAGFWLALKKAA